MCLLSEYDRVSDTPAWKRGGDPGRAVAKDARCCDAQFKVGEGSFSK